MTRTPTATSCRTSTDRVPRDRGLARPPAEALESGDIDIFVDVGGPASIADFQDADDVRDAQQDELTRDELHHHRPSPRPRPRRPAGALRAARMAIDRQELIDAIYGGILEPPTACSRPASRATSRTTACHEQDLEAAAALIEEYEAETGKQVTINSATRRPVNDEDVADCCSAGGARSASTSADRRPAGPVHHQALFGTPSSRPSAGATTPASASTSRTSGGTRAGSHPDGELSLNFGRLNDPVIDDPSTRPARRPTTPSARRSPRTINRQFAKECYWIPLVVDAVGHHQRPDGPGHRPLALPDGAARPRRRRVLRPVLDPPLFVDEGDRSALAGAAPPRPDGRRSHPCATSSNDSSSS